MKPAQHRKPKPPAKATQAAPSAPSANAAAQLQRALIKAVYTGNLPEVRRALAAGAGAGVGVNRPFPLGSQSPAHDLLHPLWFAAVCGQTAVAELLLDAGADIEGGQQWMTPLSGAALEGHADTAKLFIARGAKVHFLAQVALGRLTEVKRALAKKPALAHTADESGRTALHVAARRLDVPMARLFLKRGVPVDALTHREETPLYLACDRRGVSEASAQDSPEAHRQRALLQCLIDAGADVNRGNWRNVTPLHVAVRARSVGAVELLLKNGANRYARDKGRHARDKGRGSTPMTRAKHHTGASGTKGRKSETEAIRRLLAGAGR